MPTDTSRGPTDGAKFGLRAVAWSLGFFGLLRLNWTEAHAVLPFTRAQAAVAAGLFGASALPLEVTLACSGAEALALCLGAVLAYPVTWRARLAGAAGGAALILALNTLRIGTLGRVSASPTWFNTLHVYVWPAVLLLAIAGYVFAWMRFADRRQAQAPQPIAVGLSSGDRRLSPLAAARRAPQPSRRFVTLTVAFLLLFSAASPLYLESPGVLALAGFIARAAALILGVGAHAAGNVLWTPRGGFLVTQECISTPLVPVYLAAISTYSRTWLRLILGILATLPLFVALGIVRLLVVALPDAVGASPLFLVHAFYQLLLGAVVVFLAALWRHGGRGVHHAVVAICVGFVVVYVLGGSYDRVVTLAAGAPLDDPQGAIAFLPAFQIGLFVALWAAAFVALGWTRFFAGLALLGATQVAGLIAVRLLASQDFTLHVRDVRGWAVAGPLLVVMAVVNIGSRRR